MIIDSVYEINKALDEGKKVLVEGANAPMLVKRDGYTAAVMPVRG